MTPVTTFAGRTVALFGLGGSGLATAHALTAGGAAVVAWDDNSESAARARDQGIAVHDLRAADWGDFAAFILSPGVPLTHPAPHWTVPLARAAGVEIVGDIELFCRERARLAPDAPFVAITGTNGKSTTTALIAHLLRETGHDVQMGGNIGTPILALAPPDRARVHVVELSTFQIDLAPSLHPSIGVLLNLTPDHLDRHGTMEAYAAIKARLVHAADLAVIGVDDAYCRAIAARVTGPRVRISVGGRDIGGDGGQDGSEDGGAHDLDVQDGVIRDRDGAVLAEVNGIGSLRGAHNGQNAAVATAVLRAFGVTGERLAKGLKRFAGLPHRMEEVGCRGRVLFVNDSKATNADSTEKALTAFSDVHWIVGGKAKEGGIAPLAPLFDRIAHAYLIGASSAAFAETLQGRVPYTACETLDVATARAAQAAAASDAPEPVVLLSPACASYDQFRNFEVRGDRFRALVAALP